ncbi:sugar phosphate isomerase/epimerase family protein [Gemmata sp. JC717]|uniref:sugar phosphate isomerase/epimerase family protein n=1 Tax=Gemmata algarum TaxID=2975278 RepID=UPI0021BAA05F|nr:sugar phosphate isomerase/epimerase family protein [Gemmata algarum]MDY3556076.1 sugar phosphate isomerase/epimerase family protein [Gemmata algarum]
MKPLKIGIVAESTQLPVRSALEAAARMGAKGVQVDAVGALAPDALGGTGRREFRTLLRSFDLELSALNVPVRRGLDVAEDLQPRLERVRKSMQLAFDLGCRRVVLPCPKLPEDAASPRAQLMRESLLALAGFGDRVGCLVALEIGFDPAQKVKEYLAGFNVGTLKVTFDPANFVLHGHDPLANLMPLEGLVEHVHARDARSAGVSRGMQEVQLGAGDIDWMALTATLQVLEFDGLLAVEREQGDTKFADVANGVKFLRRFALPV